MKTIALLIVVLTSIFSVQASAKEIGPGKISGQSALMDVLTSHYFNLVNENCVREVIQKAPMRESMTAIGMRVITIELTQGTSPFTGAPVLNIDVAYSGDRAKNNFNEYAGSCELKN